MPRQAPLPLLTKMPRQINTVGRNWWATQHWTSRSLHQNHPGNGKIPGNSKSLTLDLDRNGLTAPATLLFLAGIAPKERRKPSPRTAEQTVFSRFPSQARRWERSGEIEDAGRRPRRVGDLAVGGEVRRPLLNAPFLLGCGGASAGILDDLRAARNGTATNRPRTRRSTEPAAQC